MPGKGFTKILKRDMKRTFTKKNKLPLAAVERFFIWQEGSIPALNHWHGTRPFHRTSKSLFQKEKLLL